MNKKFRKITAALLFASLIVVVGGFCYAPEIKAASNNSTHLVSYDSQDCNQMVQEKIYSKEKVPIPKDAVKPCCIDRHDKIPTTAVSDFSIGVGVALSQSQVVDAEKTYLAKNISNISSDTSPPKPDKLSSVLRLE